MNESSPFNPQQYLNVSDGGSIKDSQLGGIAGQDLNVTQTQIQGSIVNLSIYDRINGSKAVIKPKSLTRQERRQRQALLRNIKKIWITGYLKKSLHSKALIELQLEARPEVVPGRITNTDEFPEEHSQPLSEKTSAIHLFRETEEGETLLILGEPGSGKTTTLLRIAQDLITQAEKNVGQFIPVVFNLSSWASERQSIGDWLVQELNSQYLVPKALSKKWIENQDLILLLDGLDEVKANRREACVQAINEFRKSHGLTQIVISSRIRDYEALSSRLQVQSAVCLKSLTQEQIKQYLDRAGSQLEGVETLLQEDEALQELAKSPLILSVIALAYRGIPAEELPHYGSIEERRKHLLDAYIERMFRRKGVEKKYPKAKVKHYLSWLAQELNRTSQSIFLIERMQPSCLPSNERRKYQWGNVITFVIASFFIFLFMQYIPQTIGIIPSGDQKHYLVLEKIVKSIFIGLFIFGFNQKEIKTFETIKSPFHLIRRLTASRALMTTKKILCQSFLYSLIYGVSWAIFLVFIFSFFQVDDLINYLRYGIVIGLIVGAISGFFGHYSGISGLIFPLVYSVYFYFSEDMQKLLQNDNELESLFKSLFIKAALGYLVGIIFGLLARFGKPESIIFGIIVSLSYGLLYLDPSFYTYSSDNKSNPVPNEWLRLLEGLNSGLFGGMILGLLVHWTEGMQGPEIETKIKPNQGIWKSASSAMFIGIIVTLVLGVVFKLLLPSDRFSWVFAALSGGALIGLINGGGQACIRHFTLRFLLWRKGNIPWNYFRFLDYATDRIFLQKVGGGYIFIHRMLMEHFAQMSDQEATQLTTEEG
jgi:eukaryotic-like serine/threonine-protein kinase